MRWLSSHRSAVADSLIQENSGRWLLEPRVVPSSKKRFNPLPLGHPSGSFPGRCLSPLLQLCQPDAMLHWRLLDGDDELRHRPERRRQRIAAELRNRQGYSFMDRFGANMSCMEKPIGIGKRNLARRWRHAQGLYRTVRLLFAHNPQKRASPAIGFSKAVGADTRHSLAQFRYPAGLLSILMSLPKRELPKRRYSGPTLPRIAFPDSNPAKQP